MFLPLLVYMNVVSFIFLLATVKCGTPPEFNDPLARLGGKEGNQSPWQLAGSSSYPLAKNTGMPEISQINTDTLKAWAAGTMKLPESLEKFKKKQQPTASSAAVVGSGSGGGKTFPDSLERLMQRAGKRDGGGSPKAFSANRQLVRAASNLSAPSDGISSHGDTSRAPSAVPQKKGLPARTASSLFMKMNIHTSISRRDLIDEAFAKISGSVKTAAEYRFTLEEKLGILGCTDSPKYVRHMNIAAKGLMYEFVLRNIYPDIEGRMKRIEEDEFYQKLRAEVLQYEKIRKEIGDGKRQPLSIEEFGRYQEIERKFAVMDTRRDKLKESLRLIKNERSMHYNGGDIDEHLIKLLDQTEHQHAVEAQTSTYLEFVFKNYVQWRQQFKEEARKRIELEMGRLRLEHSGSGTGGGGWSKVQHPNMTMELLQKNPTLARFSSFH